MELFLINPEVFFSEVRLERCGELVDVSLLSASDGALAGEKSVLSRVGCCWIGCDCSQVIDLKTACSTSRRAKRQDVVAGKKAQAIQLRLDQFPLCRPLLLSAMFMLQWQIIGIIDRLALLFQSFLAGQTWLQRGFLLWRNECILSASGSSTNARIEVSAR